MKIFEQISKMIENEGVSIRSFEVSIGCSQGALSKCIKNGSDILSVIISKIVDKYPQYNAEWLLTGRGEMLKQKTPQGDSVLIYLLEKKDVEISRLNREVGSLQNELAFSKKMAAHPVEDAACVGAAG